MRTLFRALAIASLVLVGGMGTANAQNKLFYVPIEDNQPGPGPGPGECYRKDCNYNVYVTVDARDGRCIAYAPSVVRMRKGRGSIKLYFELVGVDGAVPADGSEPKKGPLPPGVLEFPEWQGVLSLAADGKHKYGCGASSGKERFGSGCQRDNGNPHRYLVTHRNPGGGAEDPYLPVVLYTAPASSTPLLCTVLDPKMISDN